MHYISPLVGTHADPAMYRPRPITQRSFRKTSIGGLGTVPAEHLQWRNRHMIWEEETWSTRLLTAYRVRSRVTCPNEPIPFRNPSEAEIEKMSREYYQRRRHNPMEVTECDITTLGLAPLLSRLWAALLLSDLPAA